MRPHRALPLLAATVLFAAYTTPATAQLGGLRRAVERRVEQKAGQSAEDRVTKASLIPPTFDQTTIELTAERLDRYTAAMEKQKAAQAANRQRYDQLRNEANSVREQGERADNPKEREAYGKASDRYESCRSDVREAMEAETEKQTIAMQQRIMSNPAAAQNDPKMKELVAGMNQLAQAQQSGDTAAVNRITVRMGALFGMALDSASMDRKVAPKCGARPVKPRSMVTADALKDRADALDKEAYELTTTKGGVKGSDVGMTDAQARMVWERIQSWLNGVQDSAPITRTFSKSEYDLLLARRGALRKAFANSE